MYRKTENIDVMLILGTHLTEEKTENTDVMLISGTHLTEESYLRKTSQIRSL
jgi:hypothetical protein